MLCAEYCPPDMTTAHKRAGTRAAVQPSSSDVCCSEPAASEMSRKYQTAFQSFSIESLIGGGSETPPPPADATISPPSYYLDAAAMQLQQRSTLEPSAMLNFDYLSVLRLQSAAAAAAAAVGKSFAPRSLWPYLSDAVTFPGTPTPPPLCYHDYRRSLLRDVGNQPSPPPVFGCDATTDDDADSGDPENRDLPNACTTVVADGGPGGGGGYDDDDDGGGGGRDNGDDIDDDEDDEDDVDDDPRFGEYVILYIYIYTLKLVGGYNNMSNFNISKI